MKIAAVAELPLRIADPIYNVNVIYNTVNEMVSRHDAVMVLFPSLCLTTASCGSLLNHPYVSHGIQEAIQAIQLGGTGNVLFTMNYPVPSKNGNLLSVINCIHDGTVHYKAQTPDNVLAQSTYTGVQFRPRKNFNSKDSLSFIPLVVPFHIATPEMLDRYAVEYSRKHKGLILLLNAGFYESLDENITYPHVSLARNGNLLSKGHDASEPFIFEMDFPCDCDFLTKTITLPACERNLPEHAKHTHPFLQKSEEELAHILELQSIALSKRMVTSRSGKLILGISGGLDSTLALFAACEATNPHNVIAVSMPGFGTTKRTKNNALNLAKKLGCRTMEIDIREACVQHFKDIGHDPDIADVVFENAQARERTKILMDLANANHGIVVGTGDLSECALGWCTYNGDHMSMYAVNATIPKTLVRRLIEYVMEHNPGIADILKDILETPISPELLPGKDGGNSCQKTESILGDYVLHDFYLYHLIGLSETPLQILKNAKNVFHDIYSEKEIIRTLRIFLQRFATQQFKRNCMPDAPALTEITLSPNVGWNMPSNISPDVFLRNLERS